MTTKNLIFENAIIFSEHDVQNNFIACIGAAIEESADSIILVRHGDHNHLSQIAEIICTCESGRPEWKISVNEETTGMLGIDEIPSELLSMAMLLVSQANTRIDLSTAFDIARLITENFKVEHR